MLQLMQSDNDPASTEAGFLNRKWGTIRFIFAKRSSNHNWKRFLPPPRVMSRTAAVGDYQYEVLCAEADLLCAEFADRQGLDLDLLKARVPGLSKLEGLSTPRLRSARRRVDNARFQRRLYARM